MNGFSTRTPWNLIPKEEHASVLAANQAAIREERLAAGGRTAEIERAGLVDGRHYVEWAAKIHELNRAQRYDEALVLILKCVDAAEKTALVAGMEPAPACTTYAAIEYRRRKEYFAEIEILERYIRACPENRGSFKIQERLDKARAKTSQVT